MKYQNNTKGVLRRLKKIAGDRAVKGANMVKDHAISEMQKPKNGRTYRIPGTNKTYQASAPGQYPAVRTGELINNISVATQVGVVGITGVVNVTVAHGAILEAGLRPWLSRAAMDKEDELRALFEEPWDL